MVKITVCCEATIILCYLKIISWYRSCNATSPVPLSSLVNITIKVFILKSFLALPRYLKELLPTLANMFSFKQKKICYLSFLLITTINLWGQKIQGKLQFHEGETFVITVELSNTVAQHVSNQPIDFSAHGTATHIYKVTGVDDNSTTLRHDVQHFVFQFEGMGQERNFDSDDKKDMETSLGTHFKEICGKSFDIVIDGYGKTVNTIPEKVDLAKQDENTVVIMNMLHDLTDVIYPPKKGKPSFFNVLPGYEIGIGSTWADTVDTPDEKSITNYTLSEITDSTIVVSFKTTSLNKMKMQMRGMVATSVMNSVSNGIIILDKATAIVKEKTSTIETNGTTETTLGIMPTSGKVTIRIGVKKQ